MFKKPIHEDKSIDNCHKGSVIGTKVYPMPTPIGYVKDLPLFYDEKRGMFFSIDPEMGRNREYLEQANICKKSQQKISNDLLKEMDMFLMQHAMCGMNPFQDWMHETTGQSSDCDNEIALNQFKEAFPAFIAVHPEKLAFYQQESKYRLQYAAIYYIGQIYDEWKESSKISPLYLHLEKAIVYEQLGKLLPNLELLTTIFQNTISPASEELSSRNISKCLRQLEDTIKMVENRTEFADLQIALETLLKFNQFAMCHKLNVIAKSLIRLLYFNYKIDSSTCDFFEHSIFKMAGLTQLPTEAHFNFNKDTTKLDLQFSSNKNPLDIETILTLFGTAGKLVTSTQNPIYKYEIAIDSEAFFSKFFPKYQQFLKQLAKTEPEFINSYKTLPNKTDRKLGEFDGSIPVPEEDWPNNQWSFCNLF